MAQSSTFHCIDAHTGGNPVRLVYSGGPPLDGDSMLDRQQHFMAEFDWIRTSLMYEPRGHAMMSGGILYLGGGTPVQQECGVDDTVEHVLVEPVRGLGDRPLDGPTGPGLDQRLLQPVSVFQRLGRLFLHQHRLRSAGRAYRNARRILAVVAAFGSDVHLEVRERSHQLS